MLSQLWRLPACLPSIVSRLPCRKGTPRSFIEGAYPIQRLAQDAALPIISHQLHQMVAQTGKAKNTSHYIVHSSPTRSRPHAEFLILPKFDTFPMQNATARFSAPSPWPPIQTVYRLERCQGDGIKSSSQPSDARYLIRERKRKENISDSDGNMAMGWPGRATTRQVIT